MCALFTIENAKLSEELQNLATNSLEQGQIIYRKTVDFPIQEYDCIFKNKNMLDSSHKNISYNYQTSTLAKFAHKKLTLEEKDQLQKLLKNYAEFAKNLVLSTCPHYKDKLIWGRTSYRPTEILGRKTSKRKDDTKLHVDAFPSSPVNGKRILRVFYNINPFNESRVWNTGEDFDKVLQRFKHTLKPYNYFKAIILKKLKITKELRSEYDHYMLQLHDNMKLDNLYQINVKKNTIHFPAGSSWIVYTDLVSHAAISGKFLLEQTFYLEAQDMLNAKFSPFVKIINSQ